MQEAERKNEKVLTEIKDRFKRACEDYEKKARRIEEEILLKEKYKAEQIKNKNITEAMKNEKKSLIELRNQSTEKIFSNVRKKVEDFVNSDKYEKYLINQIEGAKNMYGSDMEVFIINKDIKYKGVIFSATAIEVKISQENFIGGCKIIVTNKNIIIDNTIETKLIEAKTSFNIFKIVD